MPNQISLRAVTQIRKGVTTPRERGIAPPPLHSGPPTSPCPNPSYSNPAFVRHLYFSLSPIFFFFLSFLLLSFLFVLFSIANGRRFFETSACARVCVRGRWKPGRCPCGGPRVPTSTGERTTCTTFSIPSLPPCYFFFFILFFFFNLRYTRVSKRVRGPVPYVNHLRWQLIADRNEWPISCTN